MNELERVARSLSYVVDGWGCVASQGGEGYINISEIPHNRIGLDKKITYGNPNVYYRGQFFLRTNLGFFRVTLTKIGEEEAKKESYLKLQ